jgi:cyanophycin synthetase
MISIRHEFTYYGPNPHSGDPVVVATLSLCDSPAEVLSLLTVGCRLLKSAYPDWFPSESLHKQSSVAEVAETVVLWSLGALNEVRGCLHEAGTRAEGDGSRIWLGFHHPKVSRLALELGVRSIEHAARSGELDRLAIDKGLAGLWKHCEMHHPDYQACILMEAARALDIPFQPCIVQGRYWQFGWGCRSRLFLESMSNTEGSLGFLMKRSKLLSKQFFAGLGYPVPRHSLVTQSEQLARAADEVGWPCVIKPVADSGGRGVTAGLRNMAELEAAFANARRFTQDIVMVEEHIPGEDHRLMVVEGKLFAVIRREPTSITGDGRSTVAELLAAVNRSRSSNLVRSRYHRPIETDELLAAALWRQGADLDTVLDPGRRIRIRSNANLTTGGVCFDVTQETHPHVRRMAESVALAMGLGTVGIDYITNDIGSSWQLGGAMIEANATPGIDAMIAAGQDPVAVGSAVLAPLPGRVPVVLVVVQAELLGEVQQRLEKEAAEGTGWSCGDRAGVGGMQLEVASAHPWSGVQSLLRHREVERVLAVCTAAMLIRQGMPVDRVERTVVCGTCTVLPDEWLRLVRSRSGSVQVVPVFETSLVHGISRE